MITIGILNYKGECQTWVGKTLTFMVYVKT